MPAHIFDYMFDGDRICRKHGTYLCDPLIEVWGPQGPQGPPWCCLDCDLGIMARRVMGQPLDRIVCKGVQG